MTVRVNLWPEYGGVDQGDGGVRRVVEAQRAGLEAEDIEVVERAEDADVLASHITIPHSYVLRFPDKPIVAHCHGLYWSQFEWPNWALKANADVMELIRIADVVTAPSEWVAQNIRRHSARDVRVVPHGVDMALWEPAKTHSDYVLSNKTRPDPVCDPQVVADLAGAMADIQFRTTFAPAGVELPNLTVIGREPYEAAIKTVKRAAVYLATAQETGGIGGIGGLEALAAGVPLVGWRWGTQGELIEHQVDGWLATPGDLEDLAAGVRWAIENRSTIAPHARRKAALYTWERANAQYAEIYREVQARYEERRAAPRVSVVVTAYMLERYLDECLQSVADQTSQDWECVVVDDASPDNSGEIAEAFAAKDARFRVIHNDTNRYLAGARNVGIEAARGRYVLPLDADDRLTPIACELLGDALDRDRSIAVAYGNVEFYDEDGAKADTYWHSGWPMDFRHDWQLMERNLLPYSSMFRREAWELTGGYRERFRTAEDADLWCRMSSYGFRPRRVSAQDTLIYRNREGSMSRVTPMRDWSAWFPWSRDPAITPAGAATSTQLPIESFAPPAVAVVIPVGPGHGRYVLDAVDSVDAQTFRRWECIVVNDSGADLPRLPSWVRVINPGGDPLRYGGAAAARNAGIAAAQASLYVALDADDMLQPGALDRMLWAREESRGDIIYTDFWEDPKEEGQFVRYETPDWRPENLIRKGAIAAVTQLVPVAVWRDVGGYDESVPAWEDWAFQIACASRGYCSRRLREPLFTYRKHTGRRRGENMTEFERSKAGILERYGAYWKGDELMACRTCGGRASLGGDGGQDKTAQMARAPQDDAVLVRYESDRAGATRWRAPSGTEYRFGGGDESYVLPQDVEWFMQRPGFTVAGSALGGLTVGGEPVLAASGPPDTAVGDPVAQVAALSDDAPVEAAVEAPQGDVVALPEGVSLEEAVQHVKAARARKPKAKAGT